MYIGLVWFMVINATFNNISVLSWRSVLLVEEINVYRICFICYDVIKHGHLFLDVTEEYMMNIFVDNPT
jgi:hypothetical protein